MNTRLTQIYMYITSTIMSYIKLHCRKCIHTRKHPAVCEVPEVVHIPFLQCVSHCNCNKPWKHARKTVI